MKKTLTINDRVYGRFQINDPLLIKLIESAPVLRLKKINQHGTQHITRPHITFVSRFEHSVGVMLLLKKFNCLIEEQIAGLFHDIAHTAFSHVIDYAMDNNRHDDFHEKFGQQLLAKSTVPKTLRGHGFNPQYVTNE